jgi:hypothetical protein
MTPREEGMTAPTPYVAHKPRTHSPEELRARIPGWGVDLDPADRPSFPRLRLDLDLDLGGAAPGADGTPERQPEPWPRERSIEHAMLTPAFGTSCPPKGVSGMIRRLSYRRYSEARAAHWLLLLAADRVDAWEAHLRSFATLRPDNPVTQTGIRSEVSGHGWASRAGQNRADLAHQPLDPLIVVGPWIAAGGVAIAGAKKVAKAVAARR